MAPRGRDQKTSPLGLRGARLSPKAKLGASTKRLTLGRRAGFAAVAYAFAATMVGTTMPTPLYPIYQREFGFSELIVTVIFATFAAGVIAALLLFGQLSDHIGRRRALLPGLALSALSAVMFLLAQGLGLLLVGRAISGLSAGIFTGTATAALVDLAEPQLRARASLVATMVNMGGLACGPLIAGLLAELAGSPLRVTFWVDLGLLVPAAALVWTMPEPVRIERSAEIRPQRPRIPAEVKTIFTRAALAGFAGFAVLGLFTAVAPGFFAQILGVKSHAVVGLVVFAVFGSSTVGQIALRQMPSAVALPLGCCGLIAGMGLVALGLALTSVAGLVSGGVVGGLGQGLSFRAGLTAVNEASPVDRRAEVASSFFVLAYVALSIPVVGVGLLAELTSLRIAGLIFAAVVSALAMTVIWLLRPTSTLARLRFFRGSA